MLGNLMTLLILTAIVTACGWLAWRAWHARRALVRWPSVLLAGLSASGRSGGPAFPANGNGPAPALGTLGDFRLLREVGRGGMGVVYEAEQVSLGRRVALKVLPFAGALDPRQLARFRNEAQAAAGLHHTNVVPVYFVGCDHGVHYYAMQFIDGRTLAALIRELTAEGAESAKGKQEERSTALLCALRALRGEARLGRAVDDGAGVGLEADHFREGLADAG